MVTGSRGHAADASIAADDIPVTVAEVLTLDQTAQAHARIESGQRGRIVVTI